MSKNNTQKEIASILGISQGYLSKGLKWANSIRNKSKNIPKKAGIFPKQMMRAFHIPSPSQSNEPPAKLKLRLHRLQSSYPILNAISEEKVAALKKVMLNNNHQWVGKGFRITTQNLELEGTELWSERDIPSAVLEGVAYSLADGIAKSIADQYGFTIDMKAVHRPEHLMEMELTEHALAEHERKKGIIPLHWTKGQPDVWMDKSFGLGGLESNIPAYIQKLVDLTNDIVDYNAWEEMKKQVLINSQQIGQLAEQLNIHAPYLTAWKEVADAIGNPVRRSKAQIAIKRLSQRSLRDFA